MNAKKKTLGLAAFGAKTQAQPSDNLTSSQQDVITTNSKAVKALSDNVACTVRVPRGDWLRIQHLALDEGTSFQAIAMAGLEAELKRRGLPGFN